MHNVGDEVSGEGDTAVESDLCLDILDTSEPGVITVELLDDMLDHFLVRHGTHSDTGAMKTESLATPFDGRRSVVE